MSRIDTHYKQSSLSSREPVTMKLVSSSPLEKLWDELVDTHHYLGYQRLLGHRLKYIAYIGQEPVAALSWSASARKLRVRDHFIGWNETQRSKNLHRIVNNSRFLILPWIKISNLASHVLSLNIKRLNQDWIDNFGFSLWMLETFVDPQRFRGISYKASNWVMIGETAGFSKQGAGYIYHGNKKEIYVYILDTNFRKHIGCEPIPYRFDLCPPHNQKQLEALKMILRDNDWHPEIKASLDLDTDEILFIADELVNFHEQFNHSFNRIEQEKLGLVYLKGLLSNCERKSAEPIALNLCGKNEVRNLQRFMQTHRWEEECMETIHHELLSKKIGTDDGMITIDPSEIPKKGKESVAVARQYCGRLGKVENCQSGVFVGYSGKKGYGLLSCQLYVPKKWFSKEYEERRKKTLVPEDLVFQTKHQIALSLINDVVSSGLFPAKWLGCDGAFGCDIDFLKSIPENLLYFATIHSDEKVFLEKPKIGIPPYKGKGRYPQKPQILEGEEPITVKELSGSTKVEWKSVVLGEGAKGPILAEAACLRVYRSREGLPDDEPVWLFLRKNADGQIKFAVSNAPEDISFSKLCEASMMRWPIEQCFQEAKSHLGMDQYEHRSWPAWHRHMLYVFLGLHFLLHVRLKLKKKLQ